MLGIHARSQMLKQAKHLRRIARLISRGSLGPGPAGLNSLQDRLIQVYPEVAEAIVSKRPVVALESTIITHGMPYPENLRFVVDILQWNPLDLTAIGPPEFGCILNQVVCACRSFVGTST